MTQYFAAIAQNLWTTEWSPVVFGIGHTREEARDNAAAAWGIDPDICTVFPCTQALFEGVRDSAGGEDVAYENLGGRLLLASECED